MFFPRREKHRKEQEHVSYRLRALGRVNETDRDIHVRVASILILVPADTRTN